MFKARRLCIHSCLATFVVMCAIVTGFSQGREPAPEQSLLKKFEILCKTIGDVRGNYTMAGVINITDHANAASAMEHMLFVLCKQGDEFYYRLGTTATINEQGLYLFIDYKTKSILISKKKQVMFDTGLKNFADLGIKIQSENYKLVDKVIGEDETISLINEHHISCKQYSLTFNKQSMRIKRLFMRLSNFDYPLKTDNEKVVEVSISQWIKSADLSKYPSKNSVLKDVNGEWRTANAYKNYRIVKM